MRSNNCLACIYTRHKTGLKSSQVILYWNSHDDKSASILSSDRSIDANRCAQLWCSGTDGKYPSTARAVDATNLLHVAAAYWLRIDGTDRRTVADLGGVRLHPPWRPSEKFRIYQF